MIDPQADDQPALAHLREIRLVFLDRRELVAEAADQGMYVPDDLVASGHLEHLERDPAAELGAAEGRHVAPAVLVQPAADIARDHCSRDRVDAARETLARHEDVGHDVKPLHGPKRSVAAESRLYLVGDVD